MRLFLTLFLVAAAALPAQAVTVELRAFDSGHHFQGGGHFADSIGMITGGSSNGGFGAGGDRGFGAFDLSAFAGQEVLAATYIYDAGLTYDSPNPQETLQIGRSANDIDRVLANNITGNRPGQSRAIYTNLYAVGYASVAIPAPETGRALPEIRVPLNATAVSDLNQVLSGGPDYRFVIGQRLLGPFSPLLIEENLFRDSNLPSTRAPMISEPPVTLALRFADVPLPGSGMVLLGAIGAAVLVGRRAAARG